jgi:hypothetical protein
MANIPPAQLTYGIAEFRVEYFERWDTHVVNSEDNAEMMLLHHRIPVVAVWNPQATNAKAVS